MAKVEGVGLGERAAVGGVPAEALAVSGDGNWAHLLCIVW